MFGLPAIAQEVTVYQGEIVVAANGELAKPWVESRACAKSTDTCKTMIVNPSTNEIAKLGDQLNSRFEATGNGLEIRRAEKTSDKAMRLRGQR
jgi:hypothetical protein